MTRSDRAAQVVELRAQGLVCRDPILIASVQRDVRRLTRACREYRRIARRVVALPPEASVTRIAGEPVVGDLGERGMARMGLLFAQWRVGDAAEQLVEGLRILNGERVR